MTHGGRLPHFIIIGAAKSGTTSLINWLAEQPEVWSPHLKEPDFFSHDRIWRRGPDWYGGIFAGAEPGLLCGEASTSYSELQYSARAAERMAATIPNVKLIYILRHPIERLRSHYRHEIQRGRERRPLAEAIADPTNEYVGSSLYLSRLEPYTRVFERDQICVARFEDVVDPGGRGWSAILDHLGLADRPQPGGVWNRTADKPGYTKTMLRLWKLGLLRPARYLPRRARSVGRALLTRSGAGYARMLENAAAPIPGVIEHRIWADVSRLGDWLGADGNLWEPTPAE